MKKSIGAAGVAFAVLSATPAFAAPGLGGEIYGATVEKGEIEVETRWDQLTGGPDDGEDVLRAEVGYGVTSNLRLGLQAEFEKEPGETREAEGLGLEAVYALGNAGGIDFALYGEYEIKFDGADQIEAKLLMQHVEGPIDLKLNLIAEKELEGGEPVEFEYALSADMQAVGEFRVGFEAFGELGTAKDFLPHAEHFIGPMVRTEMEGLGPELEISVGYLFPIDKATEDTDGMLRLGLEIEF